MGGRSGLVRGNAAPLHPGVAALRQLNRSKAKMGFVHAAGRAHSLVEAGWWIEAAASNQADLTVAPGYCERVSSALCTRSVSSLRAGRRRVTALALCSTIP
mmetsp:Transcript_30473/g.66867  ORF Transcript_30473/g.66867 Transcript_30473/m.66867 type:complete len:101 (-) Transcript_30473:73-375(-)